MNNKLPEYDPRMGVRIDSVDGLTKTDTSGASRNPLLDSEDVRKEEFGKFGKPSSHAARNEETTFTPEDATDMIIAFLTDELPITSRYIDPEMVREWIARTYGL